jgi:hypothetical protein
MSELTAFNSGHEITSKGRHEQSEQKEARIKKIEKMLREMPHDTINNPRNRHERRATAAIAKKRK